MATYRVEPGSPSTHQRIRPTSKRVAFLNECIGNLASIEHFQRSNFRIADKTEHYSTESVYRGFEPVRFFHIPRADRRSIEAFPGSGIAS
jgi:hypothetical protein